MTPRPEKPKRIQVNVDAIPVDLRQLDQWVVWNWKWNGRKWDKPPRKCDGSLAKTNDASSWCSIREALNAYTERGFDGIGFVFADDDEFVGVDLDDCRDAESGELTTFAQLVLHQLATYSEISPSGNGVKLWLRGQAPTGRKVDNAHGVEIYDGKRYFTVTGHHIDSTPPSIQDRQNEIHWLHAMVFCLG